MILKKPYAILIKNFRKIHILLTALAIILIYQTNGIVTFFREYIANNYSVTVTENLVNETIGITVYIGLFAIIGLLITVYILLKTKKKPSKMYLATIGYYVILLIFIFIASILIGTLKDGLWEAASARTYRDFARLIFLPQIFFTIVLAIRSLGFNVKQFNFKDDLKEMEITEEDNAEIELNINFETYKAERKIRRFIREFKYYAVENKLMLIVIGASLVIIIGYFSIKNYEKVKYTYKEGKVISYNGMTLTFEDSIITDVDLKGDVIYKDKVFVLAKVHIKNGGNADKRLDYNNLKLYYGFNYVYPVLDLGNYFLDYGNPFMGDIIRAGEDTTFIIPYMIDKKSRLSSFKIVMYLGASTKSQKKFIAKTANIKLKPSKIGELSTVRTAKMGETISLASSTIGDSTIKLDNLEITPRYEYNYESCYKEECRTYTDIVVADNSYQNKQTFVVTDFELNLDKETSSYININDINAFANAFMQIEYKKDNKTYITKAIYSSPTKLRNKLVLQTDGTILTADEVNLLITIRNKRYAFKLV